MWPSGPTEYKSQAASVAVSVAGPTEVTVTAASALLDPSNLHVHIGRPETNCHAYIVDSALRAVPPGVAGELLLR